MTQKSAIVLKEFLTTYKITISEFSRVTDLSRTSITKYLKGHNIHPKAAKKIEEGVKSFYRILLPYEKLIE